MKHLILSILILSSTTAGAQKIITDQIDKFDGTRTVITSTISAVKMLGINIVKTYGSYIKTKTGEVYVLYFVFKSGSYKVIDKGDQLGLILSNGEKVFYEYTGPFDITTSNETLIFYVTLDREDIDYLKDKKVTDMRFGFKTGGMQFEIKENYQDALANICKLLSSYIKIETQPVTNSVTKTAE